MRKIRIDSDADTINISRDIIAPVEPSNTGAPVSDNQKSTDYKGVVFTSGLINQMEIRAESVFRPGEDDVEIVYALSGNSLKPQLLHQLSSQTIVEEATENYITSSIHRMVEQIEKECSIPPKLVIQVHTHPQGIPKPSDQDKIFFSSAEQVINQLVPGARVLFGIHAVSSEAIRERTDPHKIMKNTVKWSSVRREHEFALFTPDSKPYEVSFDGR